MLGVLWIGILSLKEIRFATCPLERPGRSAVVNERQRVVSGGKSVAFSVAPSLKATFHIRGGLRENPVTVGLNLRVELDLDAGQWCTVHVNDATDRHDRFLIDRLSLAGAASTQQAQDNGDRDPIQYAANPRLHDPHSILLS